MNPLTQIRNTQKITQREIDLGVSEAASWHARFKHSAYIFAGGLSFDLTEGDLLAVFAEYGELVDVNLLRDKTTGKSRGFAFLAYADQRSTVLAVDNLNGAKVAGRIIRVEHVDNYKKKKKEMTGESDDEDAANPAGAARAAAGAAGGGEGVEGERWDHDGFKQRHAAVDDAPPTAGGTAEPWAASNSVFALLTSAQKDTKARHAAPPLHTNGGTASRHTEHEGRKHKDKKHKKERKEGKHHHKERHDDTRRHRSRSPDAHAARHASAQLPDKGGGGSSRQKHGEEAVVRDRNKHDSMRDGGSRHNRSHSMRHRSHSRSPSASPRHRDRRSRH